jgi:MFS family permease
LAAFVALVLYELRRREPLVEVRFFRSVPFAGASVTAVGVFAAVGGFLFLNTLYLQDARGLSPLDAGLYTLPMAGAMLVASPLSGRIVGSRGTRLPLVVGSLGLIAGALMLTTVTASTSDIVLFVAYLLFGLGTGMINPPITNTAVTGMPPSQAGVAAAVASTSRQVGATLGVAVLGALAGGDMIQQLGPSFATATHTSWWVVVGIGVVMLVGAFVTTTPWALRTATETAERLRQPDPPPGRDGQATESAPAHVVV